MPTGCAGAAASGRVHSDDGVIVGSVFGIAAFTAAASAPVEIATRGVYALPKNPTAVIAQGARVAWDAREKRIDLPGTGLLSRRHRHRDRRAIASPRCACGSTAW